VRLTARDLLIASACVMAAFTLYWLCAAFVLRVAVGVR